MIMMIIMMIMMIFVKPLSHAETLSMTRGHIALGGGGLGLFGTGCMWTWPSSVTR